ncbi:hypothetical protein WJW69_004166 [Salmonella enterica]
MKFEYIFISSFLIFSFNSFANDDNARFVSVGEYKIAVNSSDLSMSVISNGEEKTCRVTNANSSDINNGGGIIHLTTDKKGILFYSSNRYLMVSDIIACGDAGATLKTSPDLEGWMLKDINFDKELYLSIGTIDESNSVAKISHLNEKNSLIRYEEFDPSIGAMASADDYLGSISLSGKYVAPFGLDCNEHDYAGVWNIKEKKKVIFPSESNSDDEIADKCQKLFEGKASLKDLGGKLVLPTK